MDVRTLAKVLQEANRLMPDDLKTKIAEHIDVVTGYLEEFGDAFDEATDQSSRQNREDIWGTVTDKDEPVNTQARSFEDVMQGWDYPMSNETPAAEQPAAEGGGSDYPTADSIVRDIYRFMAYADPDYAPASGVYEDWNAEHPLFVVIDFLKYLGESELTNMDPTE